MAPRLFLCSYAPLVATASGREASRGLGIPPFVDGSIRREPDLEHRYPSISCLCRAGLFAPRLGVGDAVVYLTVKGRYGDGADRHRRVTAVLRAARLFGTHAEAAAWYRARGLALPSNCVVGGNPPRPLAHSHGGRGGRRGGRGRCAGEEGCAAAWDRGYRGRARRHGRFVACEALWVDLSWAAPRLEERDLRAVFGRVPGTRNPGALPIGALGPLAGRLGVALRG